jgi:hypothetical protein
LQEHIASIFSVEEQTEQEISVKASGKQGPNTLKMEEIRSYETLVNFQRTA